MHLKFDSTKAIEAAAVIARREGKRIGRLRLLKLLYIADRKAIAERGKPLLGCKAVAMDNGPLHSDVYNMIKGEHAHAPTWSKFFTLSGKRDLQLTEEPENLALSRNDIEILQDVVDRHADIDDWQLSELTHGFEEWKNTYKEGTSRPIELEAIIDGVGRTDDKLRILQDLEDDEAYDRFFERHFS